VNDPVEDEEHHTWSVCFTMPKAPRAALTGLWPPARVPPDDGQVYPHQGIYRAAVPHRVRSQGATPEAGTLATSEDAAESEEAEGDATDAQAEVKAARRTARALREPVEKKTARELFTYIVEQGKKEYSVQRYKGLAR